MGSVIKCHGGLRRAVLAPAGLTGQASARPGPATVIFDNSPLAGSPGVLLGLPRGPHAPEPGGPGYCRGAAVLACSPRLYGARAARPGRRFIEHEWTADPLVARLLCRALPPGTWTASGAPCAGRHGLIHWAGTETATRWSGYMDGAVRSGEAAAAAVCGGPTCGE